MPDAVPLSTLPVAQVRTAIAGAAARTGVPFDFLLRQAKVESSLDPGAKAKTSSAGGLFQFTRGTWRNTLAKHGSEHGLDWAASALARGATGSELQQIDALRFDPATASLMAGELASDNRATLEGALGRPVDDVDLYLAHFLGAGGATKFLQSLAADPTQPGASLFPDAAAANSSVFYGSGGPRSLSEIRELLATKLGQPITAPAAPSFARATPVTQSFAAQPDEPQRSLALGAIEPMPGRLSLELAARAYSRIAGVGA